ncbi:MAG: hypothetical protein ACT452_12785, partial [Microthrixaceae bacterium]
MRQFGNTIDFTNIAAKPLGPPPLIGESTRDILDLVGRGHDLDTLVDRGIVYEPDERYSEAW